MRDNQHPSRARRRLGLLSGALALLLAALGVYGAQAQAAPGSTAASARTQPNPTVRTLDGLVRGTSSGAMDEYLGLPYAAPPTGVRRWQPPAPAARWTGIRPATSFAPDCAQPATPYGRASTSEDCLYLNVYTPRALPATTRLPVMVWLHGGALDYGESADFNPAPLVAHGIIVVTVDYRLGALGFLADSSLTTPTRQGAASGDYGLMDQQAALRWVQANIASFGGQRHAVTLAGESAGGLSVLAQLASPGAAGLFARAIVESGTYQLDQQTLAQAEARGATFAAEAGCSGNTAACLRALPVSTILADQNAAGYRPTLDPAVLPDTLHAALISGRFAHVPVLLGTNQNEYSLFVAQDQLVEHLPPVTAGNYVPYIASSLGVSDETATEIAARYPASAYPSPQLALTAVGTDAEFACNAQTADDSLARSTAVYGYEFADQDAPQRYLPSDGFPYGASHTSELSYLFDLSAPIPAQLNDAQQRLAAQMQQYWTDFVKDGRPGTADTTTWPAYHPDSHRLLTLDTNGPTLTNDYASEHDCTFWNAAG